MTLHNVKNRKQQEGFSLIELVAVLVIIGIISAFALMNMGKAKKDMTEMANTYRLSEFGKAQRNYRDLGKRSYGSIAQLCAANVLTENVVKFGSGCVQEEIGGWVITQSNESTAYLRNNFFAWFHKANPPAGDTSPSYCMGDDGILRRSGSDPLVCTITSAPFRP